MDGRARVLLWDIDGTILNTNGAGVAPLLSSFEECVGFKPSFNRSKFSGLTDFQIIYTLMEENGIEAELSTIGNIIKKYEEGLPVALKDSVPEVLADVKATLSKLESENSWLNVIATGNTYKGAKAKLESVDLSHYFKQIFCANDLAERSSIIKKAMDFFGNDSDFCVIGDTPHDIKAAKENGISCLAVATGSFTNELLLQFEPNYLLDANWIYSDFNEAISNIWNLK